MAVGEKGRVELVCNRSGRWGKALKVDYLQKMPIFEIGRRYDGMVWWISGRVDSFGDISATVWC